MTLWGGVFQGETNDAVRRLNDSLPFDWRLYDVDITGSQAWAGALAEASILSADEHGAIVAGLEQVRAEFSAALAAGTFEPAPGDEDIHTAVERRLTEIIGPTAGKLHTGRSRNDQVATDMRLWVLTNVPLLIEQLEAAISALLRQASSHTHSVMPGFTHLQPAQPITAAHWLLSFAQMLMRDRTRLGQVMTATSTCPLGSGALAGTPYPIDRDALADALGFRQASANSLDAVADRDYLSGLLYVCSLLMTHLSRLAEDLILYSTPQFGFVILDDAFSTGSSLMPQKRNPDPLELARGKTGRIVGHLTGFLATLKGLPSSYNKDLQEDKEPVFDTFDTLMIVLPAVAGLLRTMRLHPEKMRKALDETMLATDLADYLVFKGMPFREAHHTAGKMVREAERLDVKLSQLPLDDYRAVSELFTHDVYQVFDFDAAVARRHVKGGPAPAAVEAQIEVLAAELGLELATLG